MITLSISLGFIIHWSQSTLMVNNDHFQHAEDNLTKKKQSTEHLQVLPVITWHGREHNPDLLMPCLWDHAASLNKIKMEFRSVKEWLCSDTGLSEISSGPLLNDTVLLWGSLGTVSLNNCTRKYLSFVHRVLLHITTGALKQVKKQSPQSLHSKRSICCNQPIYIADLWKSTILFPSDGSTSVFICDSLRVSCLQWKTHVSHYLSLFLLNFDWKMCFQYCETEIVFPHYQAPQEI